MPVPDSAVSFLPLTALDCSISIAVKLNPAKAFHLFCAHNGADVGSEKLTNFTDGPKVIF